MYCSQDVFGCELGDTLTHLNSQFNEPRHTTFVLCRRTLQRSGECVERQRAQQIAAHSGFQFTELTDGLDDPGEINLLSHFAELYLNIDVAHQFPRT